MNKNNDAIEITDEEFEFLAKKIGISICKKSLTIMKEFLSEKKDTVKINIDFINSVVISSHINSIIYILEKNSELCEGKNEHAIFSCNAMIASVRSCADLIKYFYDKEMNKKYNETCRH